jgi:hypothetical protein
MTVGLHQPQINSTPDEANEWFNRLSPQKYGWFQVYYPDRDEPQTIERDVANGVHRVNPFNHPDSAELFERFGKENYLDRKTRGELEGSIRRAGRGAEWDGWLITLSEQGRRTLENRGLQFEDMANIIAEEASYDPLYGTKSHERGGRRLTIRGPVHPDTDHLHFDLWTHRHAVEVDENGQPIWASATIKADRSTLSAFVERLNARLTREGYPEIDQVFGPNGQLIFGEEEPEPSGPTATPVEEEPAPEEEPEVSGAETPAEPTPETEQAEPAPEGEQTERDRAADVIQRRLNQRRHERNKQIRELRRQQEEDQALQAIVDAEQRNYRLTNEKAELEAERDRANARIEELEATNQSLDEQRLNEFYRADAAEEREQQALERAQNAEEAADEEAGLRQEAERWRDRFRGAARRLVGKLRAAWQELRQEREAREAAEANAEALREEANQYMEEVENLRQRAQNAEARAETAEARAEKAEQRADAAEERRDRAEQRIEAAEKRADAAEERRDKAEALRPDAEAYDRLRKVRDIDALIEIVEDVLPAETIKQLDALRQDGDRMQKARSAEDLDEAFEALRDDLPEHIQEKFRNRYATSQAVNQYIENGSLADTLRLRWQLSPDKQDADMAELGRLAREQERGPDTPGPDEDDGDDQTPSPSPDNGDNDES